jgi:hypothetical protein
MNDVLLVAGADDLVIADYVAFAGSRTDQQLVVASTEEVIQQVPAPAATFLLEEGGWARLNEQCRDWQIAGAVLFLNGRDTQAQRSLLDRFERFTRRRRPRSVGIISSFRVHFGDRQAARIEEAACARLKPWTRRVFVIRPSFILSHRSEARAWLRCLSFSYPLLPARLKGCCLSGEELFAAIDAELARPSARNGATYTLLGPNRPWRQLLQEHGANDLMNRCGRGVARLLAWMQIGRIASWLFDMCSRWRPLLRRFHFDTLRPGCVRELLALYNPHNSRHVKIVGYNNGVIHFGHAHPGQTIVSTSRVNQVVRVGRDVAKCDAGVTVGKAMAALAALGKELPVIPNYSFVSLGTAFFVPIHGSASEFSTIGDTIERALLYDPRRDRFLSVRRNHPLFQNQMYNGRSELLLLQLDIRVKNKTCYYRKQYELDNPNSQDLLDVLHDSAAANVEIRKAKAAGRSVAVSKYYNGQPHGDPEALAFPKDGLGRLWDRLEMNPLSSALFHGLVRRFIYHVELFFPAREFAVFWETHRGLPVSKIQLRFIKRDGLPHSPFVRDDCVSADMFMLRKHRRTFDAYVKEHFREIQFNPGKHSL